MSESSIAIRKLVDSLTDVFRYGEQPTNLIVRPSTFRYSEIAAWNYRFPLPGDSNVRVANQHCMECPNWCDHCLSVIGTWHKPTCEFAAGTE